MSEPEDNFAPMDAVWDTRVSFSACCPAHNTVWEGLLPTPAKDAEAKARAHAEKHGCVVEFRKTIRLEGTFRR